MTTLAGLRRLRATQRRLGSEKPKSAQSREILNKVNIMGSRNKPNHGGTGLPHTRKSRPKKKPVYNDLGVPIKTVEELDLYLSGDKIRCLICGGEYKSLGHHLSRTHSLGAREYKEKFNIPVTRSLCGDDLKERKSAISKGIWKESAKMEGVRKSLKENISRLDGTKHKSKSTIPAQQNGMKLKKIGAAQREKQKIKYREIYISEIKEAIRKGETLYRVAKSSYQIYQFARKNPKDAEFIELLNRLKKPDHLDAGQGSFERLCDYCKKPYKTWTKRPAKTCSRECSAALKVNRVKKECIVCGNEMMLTPSNAKRLTTCGSDKCKKARRSLQSTNK